MRTITIALVLAALLNGCTAYRQDPSPQELASIHIIDRNGLSETISNKDRLDQYAWQDFLKPQPYQKVLRIYGRDTRGNIRAKITSYYPNGQPKQFLEILNTRAWGVYQEWHPNGIMKIDAQVIGGEPDITQAAEKTWIFDGDARAWNEEGILIASMHYAKGLQEGMTIHYHDTGAIWNQIPFCSGKIQGAVETFDEDGNLIESSEYNQGLQHGRTIHYWNDSQAAFVEEYQEGYLVTGRYWNKNGELVSEINEGNGFRTQTFADGRKEEQQYNQGKLEGIVKVIDRDGFILRSLHMKDDKKHGVELEYYTNRFAKKAIHPKLSVQWNDGKIHGLVKTWYENGVQENQREMSNNKKNGISTAWYKDGSLMMIEEYDQDKLVSGEYYKKGHSIAISKIKRGNGEATLYDPEGNFLQKISYVNGSPEET